MMSNSGLEEAFDMQTLKEPAVAGPEADLAKAQDRKKKGRADKAKASPSSSKATEKASKRKVSSNACEPCRKRKSKCDGKQPSCASCTSLHMTQCVYDLDNDLRRKSALRKKIERLEGVRTNFQYIIDSLCLAEEPQLGQLLHLIRSTPSINVIADMWRSSGVVALGQLQAASPLQFSSNSAGNSFVASISGQQVTGMANNLPNMEMGQFDVQTNQGQPGINISQMFIQMNRPDVRMRDIPGALRNLEMPDTVGISGGVSALPDQRESAFNQNMDTFPPIGAEAIQETRQNSIVWYDGLGHLWPTF